MLEPDDFLWFCGRAIDSMAAIVAGLGDLANDRPDLPAANSPYALFVHALGVADYWAGHLVAGREVVRDREAEFRAIGDPGDAPGMAERAKRRLADDVAAAGDWRAPLRAVPPASFVGPERPLDRGAALMHVYEELSQHHGQMEVLRDALVAERHRSIRPGTFEDLDPDWLAAKPGLKWHRPAGRLAAWVADMDFPPAPAVLAALRAVVDGADLGYPDWRHAHGGTPMAALFVERMTRRFGWTPTFTECREFDDVIQVVRLVVHLMTQRGDGIVLHTPAYPPFHDTWRSMGRRLVEVRAHRRPDGWSFDYDELERRLRAEAGVARVWVLCHPHNPLGHVFDHAELVRIAQIAERFDLVVISDEIHADLVYAPHRHVPFASLSPEVCARTVTVTSASKSFNLAGLRWAIAHVGHPGVRAAIDALPAHLTGAANLMAVTAARAAWTEGDEWFSACLAHLDRQRHHLRDLLVTHLPAVDYRVPAATYLAWLDCRALGLTEEPAEVFRRGGVELNPGPDFSAAGHGFVRLNFATSSRMLDEIVARMAAAVGAR